MKRIENVLWISLLLTISCKPMELKQVDSWNEGIVIHGAETTVKAHLQTEGMRISPKIERIYFWFEKGKINSSQGGYSGKVLHGQYRVFDRESKQLLEFGKFNKGLKVGRWLIWNPGGLLNRSEFYKNGYLSGNLFKYDSMGKPIDTLKYRGGDLLPDKIKNPKDTSNWFLKIKRRLGFKK